MTPTPADVRERAGHPAARMEPGRQCDACGAARAFVLTGHLTDQGLLTLAWCKHDFDVRERMGLLVGDVLLDNRSALDAP